MSNPTAANVEIPANAIPGYFIPAPSAPSSRMPNPFAVVPSASASAPTGSPARKRDVAPPVKKALVVGINKYPRCPLKGCLNDVGMVKTWLQQSGFEQNSVTEITDKAATMDVLMAAIKKLVAGAKAGDTLVFSYAGHGTIVSVGAGSDAHDEACICPVDMDIHWKDCTLTSKNVFNILMTAVGAGATVVLFMDCCHSGTMFTRGYGHPGVEARFLEPIEGQRGFSFGDVMHWGKLALTAATAAVNAVSESREFSISTNELDPDLSEGRGFDWGSIVSAAKVVLPAIGTACGMPALGVLGSAALGAITGRDLEESAFVMTKEQQRGFWDIVKTGISVVKTGAKVAEGVVGALGRDMEEEDESDDRGLFDIIGGVANLLGLREMKQQDRGFFDGLIGLGANLLGLRDMSEKSGVVPDLTPEQKQQLLTKHSRGLLDLFKVGMQVVSGVIGARDMASPIGSLVLLAACQIEQTAADATIGGVPHGAFTYYCDQIIQSKKGPTNLTYGFLYDNVCTKLSQEKYEQIPSLVPKDMRETTLFGAKISAGSRGMDSAAEIENPDGHRGPQNLAKAAGSKMVLWDATGVQRNVFFKNPVRAKGPSDGFISVKSNVQRTSFNDWEPTSEEDVDAVHCYASARMVADMFQRAGALPEQWKLEIDPHSGEGLDARYNREDSSIKLPYFKTAAGSRAYTCRSFDVVAHHVAHALVDRAHPELLDCAAKFDADHPEACHVAAAMHESLADVAVLLSNTTQPEIAASLATNTRGDLSARKIVGMMNPTMSRALGISAMHNAVLAFDGDDTRGLVADARSLASAITSGVWSAVKDTVNDFVEECGGVSGALVQVSNAAARIVFGALRSDKYKGEPSISTFISAIMGECGKLDAKPVLKQICDKLFPRLKANLEKAESQITKILSSAPATRGIVNPGCPTLAAFKQARDIAEWEKKKAETATA